MYLRIGEGRRSCLSYIGAAIYAAFLVVAPFEHHDLICHLKTPQHCTACTSSQLSADPHTQSVIGSCHLADLGRALVFVPLTDGVLLSIGSTGRSPPSTI